MAGIYLHIPFCKQACHYCNFHFSTSLKYKGDMLEAMYQELDLRKDYLEDKSLGSIYFGGGTPSLLTADELNRFFEKIHQNFEVLADAEITLEANPDDLDLAYLKSLKDTAINRLSIGVQSFAEADLKFMNRAHNANEAKSCIANAQAVGFDNLTVDLIYGSPTTSDQQWETNVQTLFDFQIPHISCYCLTVEEKTPLDHFVKSGKAAPVDEEQSAKQFEYLMQAMRNAGYLHYEISNFAKEGFFAKHNSNYWLGQPYLGIGPSAHSFDRKSRQWNIPHNAQYLKAIQSGVPSFEIETLNSVSQYNEYILTSLRTIWGCDLEKIKQWGDTTSDHFLKAIEVFIQNKTVIKHNSTYKLTDSGRLLADRISIELFIE